MTTSVFSTIAVAAAMLCSATGTASANDAAPAVAAASATTTTTTASTAIPMAPGADDGTRFRALFQSWKGLETTETAAISIPSSQPVANLQLTSSFGVRSDPFRGTAAMHAGIDIPGKIGTPIYATADGVVARAERAGGYGNLVSVNHGKGIETRYGHLSRILVAENTKVVRGQMIGLMGSTGRSTGSHLHYEVRIEGRAVNPMPYMQSETMVAARPQPAAGQSVAMGGPVASR